MMRYASPGSGPSIYGLSPLRASFYREIQPEFLSQCGDEEEKMLTYAGYAKEP